MVVDPKAEILIVVDDCGDYDRMVIEPHRIASILRQSGYTRVKSLAGGIFAWSNAGYQVVPA